MKSEANSDSERDGGIVFYGIQMGDKIDHYPFLKLTEIQDISGRIKIYEFEGKIKKIIVNTKDGRVTMVNVTRELDSQETAKALFELNQKELNNFLQYHNGTITYKDKVRVEAVAKGNILNLIQDAATGKSYKPWVAFLCKHE